MTTLEHAAHCLRRGMRQPPNEITRKTSLGSGFPFCWQVEETHDLKTLITDAGGFPRATDLRVNTAAQLPTVSPVKMRKCIVAAVVLLVISALVFVACVWRMHAPVRISEPFPPNHDLVGKPAPLNLPSEIVEVDEVDRKGYGGKQDKAHLGGFTALDRNGISPRLWTHMMQNWTIKSVVDVGCGKGVSTSYFLAHGARVLCVEGSHDAVSQSLLPPSLVVEHDFSRGPWWPTDTFDAVWSVEFLEHVGTRYMHNYLPIFRKAALLFLSHSNWGGWHHVEIHNESWWIQKMTLFGFLYSPELTKEARAKAKEGKKDLLRPNETATAQHLWLSLLVFINQPVAALPQHAHLFYEEGCWAKAKDATRQSSQGRHFKPCEGDDSVPPAYKPLPFDKTKDQEWMDALSATLP